MLEIFIAFSKFTEIFKCFEKYLKIFPFIINQNKTLLEYSEIFQIYNETFQILLETSRISNNFQVLFKNKFEISTNLLEFYKNIHKTCDAYLYLES